MPEAPLPKNQAPKNQIVEIAKGLGLLLMLHVLAIAGLWVLLYLGDLVGYILTGVADSDITQKLYQVWLFSLLMFGLVQWLYVLPVVWWLQQSNGESSQTEQPSPVENGDNRGLVQGLIAGAIATSFLNGGYFLMGLPMPA